MQDPYLYPDSEVAEARRKPEYLHRIVGDAMERE